ncbi:MAG: helix-turn-helix transcriptional regulator [Desulfobacterales bacterium]|nr:helix-turn-helix transcriptional regulator [Desulfobacterales bacterium]
MQAHTKKLHTKGSVALHFTGPPENKEKAINALKSLGFADTSDSIPWRDAFPEFDDNTLPGVALAGARTKEGLTQEELSRLTGIPQRHISEMENGKRAIGKERAKILAKALNIGYKVFL